MPRRAQPSPRSGVWRSIGLVLAAGLGIAAVCLLVFAHSAKQAQLAVLLGAWAVFIAAPTIFGTRRAQLQALRRRQADEREADLADAQDRISALQDAHLTAVRQAQQSQDLELRRFGEVHLARETAARREADFRLEMALRDEIERVLSEQVGALREEVALLRTEVVDKLGGQLRLERVETTTLVAPDIEALQNEIRMLQGSRESLAAANHATSGGAWNAEPAPEVWSVVDAEVVEADAAAAPAVASPTPATVAAEQQAAEQQAAEPQAAEPQAAEPQAAEPQAAEPQAAEPQAAQPQAAEPQAAPAPQAAEGAEPPSPPAAQAAESAEPPAAATAANASEQVTSRSSPQARDPFAGLPRLTPIPSELAGLIDPVVPSDTAHSKHKAEGAYVGRRRAETDQKAEDKAGGRRRAPDDVERDQRDKVKSR